VVVPTPDAVTQSKPPVAACEVVVCFLCKANLMLAVAFLVVFYLENWNLLVRLVLLGHFMFVISL
jgi:hypothetical protein